MVLLLLGLMTTMALPRMQRWHDAVQARAQGAALLDDLRSAAFAAGARRMRLTMNAASVEPAGASAAGVEVVKLTLPLGWEAVDVKPAAFLANGLCEPGSLALRSDRGVSLLLTVEGPICSVKLRTVDGSP